MTYALPALHPGYAIPTVPNGGNHTAAFTEAAATMEAHQATLALIKTLSGVAVKVLTNPKFYNKARNILISSLVHLIWFGNRCAALGRMM